MAKNSIVIFEKTSPYRWVHWWDVDIGVPVPSDWKDADGVTLYDLNIHDYAIGLEVYEDDDFDMDTGLLTTEACVTYRISPADKSKITKDLYIVATNENYVWDSTDKQGLLSPPVLADQRKYLSIVLTNVNITTGGPNGLNKIPSNFYRFWMRRWMDPDIGTGLVMVTVTKYLADDTVDTSATDTITLTCNGGMGNAFSTPLVAGIAYFGWVPGMEQGVKTFVAESDDTATQPAAAQLYVDYPSDDFNYERKTFSRTQNIFLPGVLSATGGPGSDGIVASVYVPATGQGSGNQYYQPTIHRVNIFCSGYGPHGGDLILQFVGATSGTTLTITMTDGLIRYTEETNKSGYTAGEWVNVVVVTPSGAQDVNVEIDWE